MAGRRVLIADDHPLVRRAVGEALRTALGAVELAEAGSFGEAARALDAAPDTDLVLLDLSMPGMNGFAGLAALRAAHPAVPVLVVSAAEEPGLMRQAIAYGAAGYVPKSAPLPTLGEAVRAVLDGEVWLPEAAAEAAIDDADAAFAARVAELTPQQLRVLMLVAEGKPNKLIAYEMSISEPTVKAHMSAILRKLGVHSRTQAVIGLRRLNPAGLRAAAALDDSE